MGSLHDGPHQISDLKFLSTPHPDLRITPHPGLASSLSTLTACSTRHRDGEDTLAFVKFARRVVGAYALRERESQPVEPLGVHREREVADLDVELADGCHPGYGDGEPPQRAAPA